MSIILLKDTKSLYKLVKRVHPNISDLKLSLGIFLSEFWERHWLLHDLLKGWPAQITARQKSVTLLANKVNTLPTGKMYLFHDINLHSPLHYKATTAGNREDKWQIYTTLLKYTVIWPSSFWLLPHKFTKEKTQWPPQKVSWGESLTWSRKQSRDCG